MINLNGNTANYVNSIPMPQDGVDNETAASLQPGIQQLADNVATERTDRIADTAAVAAAAAAALAAAIIDRIDVITASGSWTPVSACVAEVEGVGGGGGGGGGYLGNGASSAGFAGGGAGGGAPLPTIRYVNCPAGVGVTTVIGGGGAGGLGGTAAGAIPTSGSDGTDSSFGAEVFPGAKGGECQRAGFSSVASWVFPGGSATRGFAPVQNQSYFIVDANNNSCMTLPPGTGGYGSTCAAATTYLTTIGARSTCGFAGGVAGTRGTDATQHGGSPGGGGAGGAFGVGGAGGNGGNANNAGTGVVGGAGTNAAANTGAGGGGGGGGGCGTGSNIGGGVGGNGGSGKLIIRYRGPQATVV